MSTVKISDLPVISSINANTANTVIVGLDIPTNITGRMTLTTLAAGLYSNNFLVVGNNFTILPNVAGQFTSNSAAYVQLNLENQTGNGSGDIVVTADTGTDSDYYIDMGFNGSTYNYPGYTFAKPLDGYLVVQGSNTSPTLNGGNLIIGTTTTGKDITITQGSIDESGRVAQFIYNTGFKLLKKPLIFADGTTQNTAVVYSAVDSRISSNITTQNTFTQAAFNKANSALANTNGVYTAGDFYMSGDGFVNGTFVLANSSFGATEAALTIKATTTIQTPSQSGTMLHITGKTNVPARIIFDTFSTDGSAYNIVAGRAARGTSVTPAASQNNDVLMRIAGNGWGTTGFAPLGVSRIDFVAAENHTDTARGSKIVFYNIPLGSNTMQEIASFNGDSAHFIGHVYPEKGFIYAPRTFTGAQTAITIDFANASMLRANVVADYAISFSNFTQGKVVEVWLTNTGGTNRTFTHGCTAVNSTTNSTTYTHPSTATIVAKYVCFGTDIANVLVQVVHA